jgi:hypothetical protein
MPDAVSPKHYYHPSGIEAIQITKFETFLRGNILKYILRAPYKGEELSDLLKAQQYLAWEIERVSMSQDNDARNLDIPETPFEYEGWRN